MSANRLARCRATLDRRQPDLKVLLDGVHKPHNVGAILRTCDAVGVYEAHAVVPQGNLSIHRHCSAGAGQWIKTQLHDDVTAAVNALKADGTRVYAAHLSDRAVDFRSIDYTQPCAVLMGAELWGVSDAGAEAADEHIIIPMAGLVESLNVSVAAAVILFEAQRQREAAGYYQTPRLDPDVYRRTLFEWLHPRLATWYQDRGEDYPGLDEDGDPIRSASAEST